MLAVWKPVAGNWQKYWKVGYFSKSGLEKKYPDFLSTKLADANYAMLRSISLRKLIVGLKQYGFNGPYPGGRHLYMSKGTLKVRIPNPHSGDISRSLLAEILREALIPRDQWQSLF
jgi:hypothetical protein